MLALSLIFYIKTGQIIITKHILHLIQTQKVTVIIIDTYFSFLENPSKQHLSIGSDFK